MNRFDTAIQEYLLEKKTVSLDKIGTINIAAHTDEQPENLPVTFICDKKIATSPELIDFIAEKERKSKRLIASDLESHLAGVREFLNIGKNYEITGTGFIKANRSGTFIFLPYSETNKPIRSGTQQVKQKKGGSNRSVIQLITFLIVIAILGGLGWQAYQFFSKNKTNNSKGAVANNVADSTLNNTVADTLSKNIPVNSSAVQEPAVYAANDTVNVKYIFETTDSLTRAVKRTAQLKAFGNNAGFDSSAANGNKIYSLFILRPTKIADTLRIKDSITRFLKKDIKLAIVPADK